jgi:ribosomal-protein-alanine N-acetyltransferase
MAALFQFEQFPYLQTHRLRLRNLRLADADAVFRIRGDFEVTKFNTGPAYTHPDQAGQLIVAIQQAYQEQTEIRWGITLTNGPDTVIGICGYNYWNRRDYRASIGYDLARAYWGRGIMTEAVAAIIAFGFMHMGLNRIEADAHARNRASIRVLEKLGFQHEGVQREQFFENGVFQDLVLFALLRSEYRGRVDDESGRPYPTLTSYP